MDNGNLINEIRREYKEYVKKTHPDWRDSTINPYVSDGFYIWNHTLVPSFTEMLASEEKMKEAEHIIRAHLRDDVKAANWGNKSEAYYNNVCNVKKFLDDTYGGIKNRAGRLFGFEEEIYLAGKKVYEGLADINEMAKALHEEVKAYAESSYKISLGLVGSFIKGEVSKRRASTELTVYFIKRIYEDYGDKAAENALSSVYGNILYYYEVTGQKSESIRKFCSEYADKIGIDMNFDESMFNVVTPKRNRNYWMYAAGPLSRNFEKDYKENVIAIGWNELGDLTGYESKESMRKKLCEIHKGDTAQSNSALATWQFTNEMHEGDIVYVKAGQDKILGRCIVQGEYEYIPERGEYANVRKVKWTHKGSWDFSKSIVQKTLTNISDYTGYVKLLEEIFSAEVSDENDNNSYTEKDFLNEVYMSKDDYRELKELLERKKNIILQGAPGVGKTFAAEKLAYSVMGKKDKDKIKFVQFHQSYSYEDFIMGYRPTEQGGFELKTGVFYDFCKKAYDDKDNDYFFIIDEINRGNLSKIFGELFVLLESGKRGDSIQLLYQDEQFSIPENLYIIGMMNTADRSLAMLDYALRRRFGFYELEPAFNADKFIEYRKGLNSQKLDNLISKVQELNKVIEEDDSLGKGFCIGHSYFCNMQNVEDAKLKSIVKYELIPMLKEYWYDNSKMVDDWTKQLEDAIK